MMTANRGLSCKIENDQLIICIGVKALGTAARNSPYIDDVCHNKLTGQYDEDRFLITDATVFAGEVCRELNDEEEDGGTLIHRMLDKAVSRAVENGAEGCWTYDQCDPRPSTASAS